MSENIAVITEQGERISYDKIRRYMGEFQSYIKEERSLVIIMAANTLGSLVGYISCMKGKHVPVMLRDNLAYEQLKEYISEYKPNYAWIPERWLENNRNVLKEQYQPVYSKYGYVLLHISQKRISMHDELAFLLTTSGTTGNRKLVRLSYKNLTCNTKSICKYLKISNKDIAITSLPMSYTYGLSVINTHLYKGATILLTEKAVYTHEFWEHFHKYRATTFSGVPFMYEMMIKFGVLNDNIESLTTFTVAGGKLSITEESNLLKYAEKFNKKVIVMYGQTEATARISYRPYKDMLTKMGSIGIPIPGGSMWLENQHGDMIMEPYNHGEITYQGDNVCMGYSYNYRDLIKGYENKDILHTGDIGYIDEDGYFYVLDRCDGSIKLNGHRVDLKDMEKMLREKYPDIDVKCRAEKCFDSYADKKLRIEITTKQKAFIDKIEVARFLEMKTGLNHNLVGVTLI